MVSTLTINSAAIFLKMETRRIERMKKNEKKDYKVWHYEFLISLF